MAKESKNQTLGAYIRQRRLSRGWSLGDVADRSRLHVSYWSKLESGQYESPSPKHLQVIARTLGVHFEDLYGLAGYDIPERLPSFTPYLRAKYGELPPEAVDDIKRYFDLLRNYYGVADDQPVFPPKPSDKPAAPEADDEKRRAA